MILGIIITPLILIVLLAYIFLIAPARKRRYSLPEKGYAHRGLWNEEFPENSIPAFNAAVKNGFGIECDVQLTKDGKPIIFHDDTLIRMCGVDKRVCELTLDEIKKLKLADSEHAIPTFEEFLECVSGKVPLLIELKGVTFDTSLCDTIVPILDGYEGEFVIESFNPILLGQMKDLRPDFTRGQLVTVLNREKNGASQGFIKNFLLAALMTNFISRPDFISYDKKYPNGISLFLTTRVFGAKSCVWTVNNEKEYQNAIKKGVCPIFDGFTPEK